MVESWIIPTLAGAYENRDQILKGWDLVKNKLLGRKTSIAVTGIAAAGKTVLLDHLTGTAYSPTYQVPAMSRLVETGVTRRPGKRMALAVVPGQPSDPRNVALDDLFHESPVEGVIHVVSAGYVNLRNRFAEETLVKEGVATIAQLRDHQLQAELDDLEDLCARIRQSHTVDRKPKWLVVAVTKADLYHNEIDSVERRYSEHCKGAFSDKLNGLMDQVGSDNFSWSALPVCSVLDDFQWNGQTVVSALNPKQRDALVIRFLNALGDHCAR